MHAGLRAAGGRLTLRAQGGSHGFSGCWVWAFWGCGVEGSRGSGQGSRLEGFRALGLVGAYDSRGWGVRAGLRI